MQQSSATPKNKDVGRGLWNFFAYSQPYLQYLLVSIVFGTVSPYILPHLFNSFFLAFGMGIANDTRRESYRSFDRVSYIRSTEHSRLHA